MLLLCANTASAGPYSVPLDKEAWSNLAYRNIPQNAIRFDQEKLSIEVDSSASPLVFRLPVPRHVSAIRVEAQWSGSLDLNTNARQGATGNDDFVLKVGLVESGTKTLNWMQRRMAAGWINELYDMAPEGYGIERIHFLSTTQDEDALGESRQHPLSDLLYETRIVHVGEAASFEMHHQLDTPTEVLGLWISTDGDDTGSRFEVELQSITLFD